MAIIDDFDRDFSLLQQFKPKLETLIKELLSASSAKVNSITARIKERESVMRKLEKSPGKYQNLAQITDICGARVITYFEDDVDAIAKVMEAEFAIDWTNSIDKRASSDADRFGYASVHYIASLKQSRTQLAEYSRFHAIFFELQIRSILQHTWAEIEHDLQYKSHAPVPRELKRRFARLAGLLEIADAEFMGIRDELGRYQLTVPLSLDSPKAQISLDLDSIKTFIQENSIIAELDRQIASIIDVPVIGTFESSFAFEVLTHLGITTVDSLQSRLAESPSRMLAFAKVWLKNPHTEVPIDSVAHGISLFYFALDLTVSSAGGPAETARILRLTGFRKDEQADKLAEELHEAFGSLSKLDEFGK